MNVTPSQQMTTSLADLIGPSKFSGSAANATGSSKISPAIVSAPSKTAPEVLQSQIPVQTAGSSRIGLGSVGLPRISNSVDVPGPSRTQTCITSTSNSMLNQGPSFMQKAVQVPVDATRSCIMSTNSLLAQLMQQQSNRNRSKANFEHFATLYNMNMALVGSIHTSRLCCSFFGWRGVVWRV